jgi:HD superfamily phosphodiesterase
MPILLPETRMVAEIMRKMVNYFGTDVRRINHALKVHAFSQILAEGEQSTGQTRAIIEYAAILHDIGIQEAERKYNSSAGNYQEIEGPPIAREILLSFSIPEKIIERVCFIIGNHHTYASIDGLDFQILVEADFLVNIHEDNMAGDAIQSIYDRIFKTGTGKQVMRSIFLNHSQQ